MTPSKLHYFVDFIIIIILTTWWLSALLRNSSSCWTAVKRRSLSESLVILFTRCDKRESSPNILFRSKRQKNVSYKKYCTLQVLKSVQCRFAWTLSMHIILSKYIGGSNTKYYHFESEDLPSRNLSVWLAKMP